MKPEEHKFSLPPERPSPMLHLDERHFPGIRHAKIGQVLNLNIKGKVNSLSANKDEEKGEAYHSGSLELTHISDGDFNKKSYKDIIEETKDIEEEKKEGE